MSTAPFLVGVTTAVMSSFAIVELLSDRRCFDFRRRNREEFILSSIYRAKLSELVRSEVRAREQESVMETQARRVVNEYVIPNVNKATASVNGFVSKNTSTFSFASLFNSFQGK